MTAQAESLIYQGPCSDPKYQNCNQFCIDNGFPVGGKCAQGAPGAPVACYCIVP